MLKFEGSFLVSQPVVPLSIRTCVTICLFGVGIKVYKVMVAHQGDKASQDLRVTAV